MNTLTERFLKYVRFSTQSDSQSDDCPSTPGQRVFAGHLKTELEQMGLSDITLDSNGYLMAKLLANTDKVVPTIGFIAHLDTAAEASGENVNPKIISDYQGGDIPLGTSGEVLSPQRYPRLNQLQGHDLIITDGTTLLGADNKAGVAEIMTAMEDFIKDPTLEHGDICICFTPDEEIGRGADRFDVERFGAQWAYTVDGGMLGELEYENFNASSAKVICHGVSVHPGTAKGTLVNAMNIAARFQLSMPQDETPETTEGYEGFYHLTSMVPGIAKTELHYILRDFDLDNMAKRKAFMQDRVQQLNASLADGHVEIDITDSYFNMREKVEPFPHIIDIARQSMVQCGIEPLIKPIRGGTDGARLSFMGLPCPNLFTGGYNFHGVHEFASINEMTQAVEVIKRIVLNTVQL